MRKVQMIKLDNSQLDFCESKSEYIRLLAPAGSGKTLSLLWRCKWLYENRNDKACRFLIFTFTTVARDELKDRILNDPTFSEIRAAVRIETLNQWGYNYLRKNVQSSLMIQASKMEKYFLVNNILRPIWDKYTPIKKVLLKKKGKYSQLIEIFDDLKTSGFRHDSKDLEMSFVSQLNWLSKNGLERFFNAKIETPLEDIGLIDSSETDISKKYKRFLKFWKESCEHLWKSLFITLDDQKYWALLKLQERYCDSFFPEPNRYHHILVDEFQDINPLDLFLIKKLHEVNRSSLTIVGDDDQAIYEWRGSTPHFILKPELYFEASFENYILSTNYRSPRNIVQHSIQLIEKNIFRIPKSINSKTNVDADIIIQKFETHIDSIDYIKDIAKEANQNGSPKQLAIIGRKKSQIIPLQIVLTSENIPFYAKEDLNIMLSNTFNELKDILLLVAKRSDKQYPTDIIKTFINCCNKIDTYDLRKNEKNQLFKHLFPKYPETYEQVLQYFQEYEGPIRGSNKEHIRIAYLVTIANLLEVKTVTDAIEYIGTNFKGLKKHYAKSEDDIFYKDPPFFYLAEYAKRYKRDFTGFITHVDKAIAKMAGSAFATDDKIDPDLNLPVHLMTAIRAKGKEYNTVILLDVNDGIWPSKLAEIAPELEQERRLFYVAITRARKKLIMIPVERIENNIHVSPYISEMGL